MADFKFAVVCFLLLLPMAGLGQSINIESMTDEEIQSLSEEQLNELPYLPLMTRAMAGINLGEIDQGHLIAMLETMLYDLHYYSNWPTGEMTEEVQDAIRLFQSDLGKTPTGEILAGEAGELNTRHDLVHSSNVNLSGLQPSFAANSEYANVEGTWVFTDGTEMYDPIQTSEIECFRSSMRCREANAYIMDSISTVNVDIYDMQITKWSDREIVAEDESATCAIYTMAINLYSKKVTKFRRNSGLASCEGIVVHPQTLELVKGADVSNKIKKARAEQKRGAHSSAYKEVLLQLGFGR